MERGTPSSAPIGVEMMGRELHATAATPALSGRSRRPFVENDRALAVSTMRPGVAIDQCVPPLALITLALVAFFAAGFTVLSPTIVWAQGADGGEVVSPEAPRTIGDLGRSSTAGDAAGTAGAEADSNRLLQPATTSFWGRYLRMLGWLLVVLGLVIACAYALKRFRSTAAIRDGDSLRSFEVVSRLALTTRHQLVVVRIGPKRLVLGVSPESIQPVCELDSSPSAAPIERGPEFQQALESEAQEYATESAAEASPRTDQLAPYRREVDRLRTMVGSWRQQNERGAQG